MQRISRNGQLLWGDPGIEIDQPSHGTFVQMIPDEDRGVIVAYSIIEGLPGLPWTDIVAQRVDRNGNRLWGPNGVAVSSAEGSQINPQLVSDGAGGTIVTWMHESDSASDCYRLTENCDIYAQRVSASGVPMWQTDGIPISTAANYQHVPYIVADAIGGAVIAWQDCRHYPGRDSCATSMDLYAQHVSATGETSWVTHGAPLSRELGNQGIAPGTPMVTLLRGAADLAGGIVFAWPDGRRVFCEPSYVGSDCDVFAQRVLLGVDTDGDLFTDAFDEDDDNDGIPDEVEVANGLDPLDAADAVLDADNDGLTNLEEHQLGTLIGNADTDGDGTSDGDEVLAGRNPNVNEFVVIQIITDYLFRENNSP
jgi:hypothetical protein